MTLNGLGNDLLIYNQLPATADTILVKVNATTTAAVGPIGGIWHGLDCLVPTQNVTVTVLSSNVILSIVYTTPFPGTSLMLLTINGTAAAPLLNLEHLPRNLTLQIATNDSLWQSDSIPYNHATTQQLNVTLPPPMLAHTSLSLHLRSHYYIANTPWFFYVPLPTTVTNNAYYSISYYHSAVMNTSCSTAPPRLFLIGEFFPGSTYICSFLSCDGHTVYNSTSSPPFDSHFLTCDAPKNMPTIGCEVTLTMVTETAAVPNTVNYPLPAYLKYSFFFPHECHSPAGGGDEAAVIVLAILFSVAVALLAVVGYLYYRQHVAHGGSAAERTPLQL